MKTWLRYALRMSGFLIAILALGGTAIASPQVGESGLALDSRKTVVAQGVTIERVYNDRRELLYYVLSIDPTSPSALDVTTARSSLPGFVATGTMVANAGAIAGVNGDFGVYPGRPLHLLVEDGNILQTSLANRSEVSFATTADRSVSWAGPMDVSITATRSGHDPITVSRWNQGAPGPRQIAGYSGFGGTLETPAPSSCYVRLAATGALSWRDGQDGTERLYTVDAKRCGETPMDVSGGIVLSAQVGAGGERRLLHFDLGDEVTVGWSAGRPGVTDIIGGNRLLVSNGEVAVGPCSEYICWKQPRTSIGSTADGTILLVVVEGRSAKSRGLSLVAFGRLMKKLGAQKAINMDGGGSSTMIVDGRALNFLPDGEQRRVSTAVVVLPGADSGEQGL